MKGIILSGGTGSRLYPLTSTVNKQLLPVYDKPMIYYPFCTMISCGITEICIISTPEYLPLYEKLFGNGNQFGLKICYKVQYKPKGIAESFIIAEEFINNEPVGLILGDNIFHGMPRIKPILNGAIIFAYEVNDPSAYGVVEFDENGLVLSIEEKPKQPKSKYAIPGLYFYDKNVVEYAKQLKPSLRGELEITDLNKIYLDRKQLGVIKFPRGTAWLDAGSPETLFQSGMYIQSIQERQGIKVACIEEECYNKKFINKNQLKNLVDKLPISEYKQYLEKLL
jgi:glucose-1-phosphate thymidylyltransferase|tara:strand:+ start:168 stop:1010 length:843 start_codon:yes stop_codon:yes gene_type:complete